MRADFYLLGDTPVESAIPALAVKTMQAGQRMLIVSAEDSELARISDALWAVNDTFVAHGRAGAGHEPRQPILLAQTLDAANDARFLVIADGTWRDGGDTFERVFLMFSGAAIDNARATWRELGQREEVERHFWKQTAGRWIEGP